MRERGSNTARPTKKGGGGSPDWVDWVDFGASIGSISSRFADFLLSFRADSRRADTLEPTPEPTQKTRHHADTRADTRADTMPTPEPTQKTRHPSRHHADTMPTPEPTQKTRHRRQDTEDKTQKTRHRRQDTKKPDSSIGESGFSYRKASRALNLLLVPLSNTCASARSVLRGLVRRSCIVMLTSDRRHIVHYT